MLKEQIKNHARKKERDRMSAKSKYPERKHAIWGENEILESFFFLLELHNYTKILKFFKFSKIIILYQIKKKEILYVVNKFILSKKI